MYDIRKIQYNYNTTIIINSKNGIKKSIVIPHGVGNEFKNYENNSKITPSYLPKKNYIVYPSIIDVYKSQKELIEAIKILRDKGVDVPTLILVGESFGQ